jgi:hypothetical protein
MAPNASTFQKNWRKSFVGCFVGRYVAATNASVFRPYWLGGCRENLMLLATHTQRGSTKRAGPITAWISRIIPDTIISLQAVMCTCDASLHVDYIWPFYSYTYLIWMTIFPWRDMNIIYFDNLESCAQNRSSLLSRWISTHKWSFFASYRYETGYDLLSDQSCQKKLVCELYQDTPSLGEFGRRGRSNLELALRGPGLDYASLMPDQITNALDEFKVSS